MSKNIVSRTLSVHQEHELLMKLEDAGLGKEKAQLVIDSKNNKLARKMIALIETELKAEPTHDIVVDYSRSLNAIIKAGKYNCVNSDINTKHFPSKGKGKHELTATLFHLDRYIESNDAIAKMDKQGCRAGTVEELLALGEKYPDLQKEFPIVALGSVWRGPSGLRYVACLIWDGSKHRLHLFCFDHGWLDHYRFLAFRK